MLTLDRLADGDLHTLADFAELLCLLKPDRILSTEDIEDHLFDEAGEARGKRPIQDAFAHLSWRTSAFGDAYPFTVADNQQSISAPDDLTIKQKSYVLLLLCANLPYFERCEYAGLTNAFERAAHAAMQRMWPNTGHVRKFGKNNADYQGTKAERMRTLAMEIGCRPVIDTNKFRPRDSGDGGIDLAAWLELDLNEPENKPTALAQCACSREEWSTKQSEISHKKLGKLFNPTTPWLEFIFIPICFRNNNGRWAVDADVDTILLIDRPRLIYFLVAEDDWQNIAAPEVLDKFLSSRLEVA